MSAVMLILSAAPSLTAAAAEKKTAWVKGDANGDGTVSISDVTCIQNYLADFPVGIVLDAADVTGDGEIAVTDVTNIQYFLAGLPSSLDSKLSNDELYELSVRDAVFADEDEIMPPVNISKDDDRVIWDGDKVLVTITHKYPEGKGKRRRYRLDREVPPSFGCADIKELQHGHRQYRYLSDGICQRTVRHFAASR